MPSALRMTGTRLEPLSIKQQRDAENDKVYIFNVSPREHRVPGLKVYVIPACAPGMTHSEPLVIPGVVYQTRARKGGESAELEWFGEDGIDVANAIIGQAPFQDLTQDLTKMGVFISKSPVPSGPEILKAQAAWYDWCDHKVTEAKRIYSLNNGMATLRDGTSVSNIGSDHRDAAAALGLEFEWSAKNRIQVPCVECGKPNVPTAARCANPECRCIFDEAKARQRYPEMFAGGRQRRTQNEEVAA